MKYTNWAEDEINKISTPIPISLIKGENNWIAATNSETKEIFGLYGFGQAATKEEAIIKLFASMKNLYKYSEKCRQDYERWVPLRIGDWRRIGGCWFVIFGLQFYFRYGKNMKRGWYIPFTNLNITISNKWIIYNKWKKDNYGST